MPKKNTGKVIQMLSPENYIRTKARTLPIYECLINSDWEDTKLANLVIARGHVNGNRTTCMYLVDLLCLGLKDTHYIFNIPMSDYKEMVAEIKQQSTMVPINYALAHNIILAGIEYAEEFEFKPHKDYTSITKYFLDEDTDEIPLIEIDCGDENGQALYVYNNSETSPQEVKRILAQLERTAGPGNYSFINGDEVDEDEEEYEDEEIDTDLDFSEKSFNEKKEIFCRLYDDFKNSAHFKNINSLNEITDALFEDITDPVLVDNYYDELSDILNIKILHEEFSNELLGVTPETEIDEDLKNTFVNIFSGININLKKARIELEFFRKAYPGIPAVSFLELLLIQKEGSKAYPDTLEKYHKAYPDYAMIRLLWLIDAFSSENIPEELANNTFNLDMIFPGRDSLDSLEIFYYLLLISIMVTNEGIAEKMEAFYLLLNDIDLPDPIFEALEEPCSYSRLEYLVHKFNL